jgi:hypothetical protein
MKFKLLDYKSIFNGKSNKTKVIGEVILDEKIIINTKSLDDNYICNGKLLNSENRVEYQLQFLKKYDKHQKHGKVLITYNIFSGTIFTAFLKTNIISLTMLKFSHGKYLIQRVSGLKRFLWEFIVFVTTIWITWLTSKC